MGPGEGYQGPVAWAVCDATWYHDVRLSQWTAEAYAAHLNAAKEKCVYKAVPLYRSPALTPEEREAVQRAFEAITGVEDWEAGAVERDKAAAATLRALLDRTK